MSDKSDDRPAHIPSSGMIRRFLVFFFGSLFLLLAVAWPIYLQYLEARERATIERIQDLADINEKLLKWQYGEIYGDVRLQASLPDIRRHLATRDEASRTAAEAFLIKASDLYGHYEQIRLLDLDGNELLRISRRNGLATAVPQNRLQSKADSYYFKQILRLAPDQIYTSPVDLNMEYGRLEYPYRPTQRIAAVVTDEQGQPRGAILLNHNPSVFFSELQASMKPYAPVQVMLMNLGGFWISDADPANEWGWMFKRNDVSMAVRNPELWRIMRTQPRGQIRTADGVYLFRHLDPLDPLDAKTPEAPAGKASYMGDLDPSRWHIVMAIHIPEEAWLRNTALRQPGGQLTFALVVLLLMAASWSAALFRTQKIATQAERARHMEEMERHAHTDVLTGAFNRRHIYLFGERELSRTRRTDDPLSLLMLDIDQFKLVNDEYGHDIGDQALKLITRTCLDLLRSHDLFARIGGEEFAALLPHTGIADAVLVAERIRCGVAGMVLPLSDGRELRFTVSIGAVQWHAGDDDLDALFKRADRKLYEAKETGRDRVCA